MTKFEKKQRKVNQKRKMIIPLAAIAVGLGMVITALVMEAGNYPWGVLFGTASQNADSIPEPSPIVLDEEDQAVIITEAASPETTPIEVTEAPAEGEVSPSPVADLPGNEADTKKAPAVTKYVILGTLKIPVLGVSQNLLEGAGKQMKYGVGHLPSSAAVGQKGNCAVAGHRPYPFRYLDQLKAGDSIVIKSGGITYTYTVFESLTVLPNEVWVLNKIPGEDYALTLITCTPYMVSSHRLIIRARLTDIDGMTPQAYYGETSPESMSPESMTPESMTPEATPTDTALPDSAENTDTPPAETGDIQPSDISSDTASETPAEAPPTTEPSGSDAPVT